MEDNDNGSGIEGSDEDPDFDRDSEYPESDEEDEEFKLHIDVTPRDERQFLMSAVQLAKLLQNCCVCESECHTVVNGGTMISTSFMCPKGNSSILESQKAILECHGQICWLPVLLCLVETMPRKASESFKPEDDVHVHIHQPAGNL